MISRASYKLTFFQFMSVLLTQLTTLVSAPCTELIRTDMWLSLQYVFIMFGLCGALYAFFCVRIKSHGLSSTLTAITHVLIASAMLLPTFIIPAWQHTPESILQPYEPGWMNHMLSVLISAPYTLSAALAHIINIWFITFAFWQIANNSLSVKSASKSFPIFIAIFAAFHTLTQKALCFLSIHSTNPQLLLAAIALPATILYSNTLSSYHIPTPSIALASMLRTFFASKHRPFFFLNATLATIAGVFVSLSCELASDLNQHLGEAITYIPSVTAYTIVLSSCAAFFGFKVQRPTIILQLFIALIVAATAILFMADIRPSYLAYALCATYAVKYAKHALFTAPKQLIFMSWSPSLRIQGKAFFDLIVDRLAFAAGAFSFHLIKVISYAGTMSLYSLISAFILSLTLIAFCSTCYTHKAYS